MKTTIVYLSRLKVGDAFTFSTGDAPIYVRCKGGYRPGRGGPLVKFSADQKVMKYFLENIK